MEVLLDCVLSFVHRISSFHNYHPGPSILNKKNANTFKVWTALEPGGSI